MIWMKVAKPKTSALLAFVVLVGAGREPDERELAEIRTDAAPEYASPASERVE